MKYRAVASVALAAAFVGGLAGCNMISPQSTTIQYDASDGVGVSLGDVELRNLFIIVESDGTAAITTGSLVGTVVNHTDAVGEVRVEADGASASIALSTEGTITKVGFDDGDQVLLEGATLELGGTIEVTFTSPDGTEQTAFVPILDGTLLEYSTLAPVAPAETEAPIDPAATPPINGDTAVDGVETGEGDAAVEGDETQGE